MPFKAIRMRSLGLTKRSKCILLKKYFDKSFKVKSGSLWDVIPQECKDIIRDFARHRLMAERIQKHWRMVRFGPGESPPFRNMSMQTVYVTEQSGYRRCTYRYTSQRAIIHWHGTWEGAYVSKAGGGGKQPENQIKKPWQYYTAKLYGDHTAAENGRATYYYDLEKRMHRLGRESMGHVEGQEPVLVPWEPAHVSLIKPW